VHFLLFLLQPTNAQLKSQLYSNLARHKCKTPWRIYRNVETCRSIYYTKRYCCDINCECVDCNKHNKKCMV